jgi:hypothetical protein
MLGTSIRAFSDVDRCINGCTKSVHYHAELVSGSRDTNSANARTFVGRTFLFIFKNRCPRFIRPYSISESNHALGLFTETQCHIMQPIKQPTTSILDLLSTTQQTSSSGSDETSLLTLCGITGDCRGFTNMLMITTTVRMIDGIHGNTTSLWP